MKFAYFSIWNEKLPTYLVTQFRLTVRLSYLWEFSKNINLEKPHELPEGTNPIFIAIVLAATPSTYVGQSGAFATVAQGRHSHKIKT